MFWKKYRIKKIQYKKAEYNGRSVTLLSGHMGYKGSIQILVNEVPKGEDFVFRKIGVFLFAEKEGFVEIYRHDIGSTDGFAGREITLNVEGEEKTFKGSLWDPTGFDDMGEIPEYRSVSITDDPKVMETGYTFYSGYVTKKVYDKLAKKLRI